MVSPIKAMHPEGPEQDCGGFGDKNGSQLVQIGENGSFEVAPVTVKRRKILGFLEFYLLVYLRRHGERVGEDSLLSYRTTNGVDVGAQLANDLAQMKMVDLRGGTIDVQLAEVYVDASGTSSTSDAKCRVLDYYVKRAFVRYSASGVPSWPRVDSSTNGRKIVLPGSSLVVFRDVLSMKVSIVVVVTVAESADAQQNEILLIEREYHDQQVSGGLELSLPTELAEGLSVSGSVPNCPG